MVLDSKIAAVKNYFGISDIEDWHDVEPSWVLNIDGVGPVTLDHIRMYLAARGHTLKNDRTPEYWRDRLSEARICHTMGEDDIQEMCPFTVLVDGREKAPFTFAGIQADSDRKSRPLFVPKQWATLPTGDYSIEGYSNLVTIERKSLEDLFGSVGQHRDRFEREHERMAEIVANGGYAAVVIEAGWDDLMESPPSYSKLPPKAVFRTWVAWSQRYNVPWCAMGNRRLAEIATFRMLERFWKERTVGGLF